MRVRVLIWVMVLVVVRMTDEVKKCRQLRRREVKSRPPLLLQFSRKWQIFRFRRSAEDLPSPMK